MSGSPRGKQLERERRKTIFRHVVDGGGREAWEPRRPPNPIKCQTCCDQPWRRELICEECGLGYEPERLRQA